MLLLYLVHLPVHYIFVSFIYIPLCFYFICFTKKVFVYPVSYLHSIMLLLYRLMLKKWKAKRYHLHSIMLLLYLLQTIRDERQYKIYIPLCFYFIWYIKNNSTWENNLHSIMLLLYQMAYRIWVAVLQIYIPLCFYFIYRTFSANTGCYLFTFHYASTLSEPSATRKITVTIFTFHYASTLSVKPVAQRNNCGLIYIPLCFYFISKRLEALQINPLFTFHYASTLSWTGVK